MSVIHVKPRRRQYGPTNPLPLAKVEIKPRHELAKQLAPLQPRQGRVVIDAAPIMADRRKAELLRRNKGLVSAWTLELERMEADLRGMATRLMEEITTWLVMRPNKHSLAW